VKITLKSSFNLNEIQLETESTTLGALLDELQNNNKLLMKVEFFDSEHREVYPDCDVLVNGQSYQVLADGLDTKLRDGDKVEIITFMFMLAGG